MSGKPSSFTLHDAHTRGTTSMRLTIKAKLGIGFSILLLMLAGSGVFSYMKLSDLDTTLDWLVDNVAKRMDFIGQMESATVATVKAEKEAILSVESSAIAGFVEETKKSNEEFRNL